MIADQIIETLALSEAELRERVASLEADVRSQRELAHSAIAALADLTARHDTLRTTHSRLLEDFRVLRRQMLRANGVYQEPQAAA